MPDLAVLIPTRGRPGNIRKVIEAWDFTGAWDHASMFVIADEDDPEFHRYRALWEETVHRDFTTGEDDSKWNLVPRALWQPMVHKLDAIATPLALSHRYFALAFAGDDHLPRTIGWAKRYLDVLREMRTGMVYGDDGYQGANLATQWAVTTDAVRALGRMVPAPVEHMYCDNAIMELFGAAGALRYLPEVQIEHMHPIVKKADSDEQYRRVNSSAQFTKDRQAYQRWAALEKDGQVAMIRKLRAGLPDVPHPTTKKSPTTRGARMSRLPFPRHFKRVTGATPPDIELTLADLARNVPGDQEIVELGVYQGRTALIMAWAARPDNGGQGAHVTAIDPWELEGNVYDPPFTDKASRRWARYNVQSLGYSRDINLVQDFSQNIAEIWNGEDDTSPRPVGLLFVDGDHTAEGARRDIETWAPHLAGGAVIAVDDYGHPDWPGVKEAVDALVEEGVLEPIQLFHERLAVTRPAKPRGVEPGTGRVTAITGEGVATSPEPSRVTEEMSPPDSEESNRLSVHDGELGGVEPGTEITALNLGQLRALARHRGITLGARKDKRAEILRALADGK